MSSIIVVGGVYGEDCAFPLRKQIFGSAGRAAIALSGSNFSSVTLHTTLPKEAADEAIPNFDAYAVDVVNHGGEQFVGFEYLHCLATPVIHPSPTLIRQQMPFHVKGELVVQFGMMECSPTVEADICVYDPQSPTDPRSFRKSGSTCGRLAFIANANEIELLTGLSLDDGARQLVRDERAEILVAKCGLQGAKLFDKDGFVGHVPAYKASSVFTIGSGDVFVSAFALAWASLKLPPMKAAEYASQAVASYVETEHLPLISIQEAIESRREAIKLTGGKVYLAGPFREIGQRVIVNEARKVLSDLGMQVFSPVHDIGHGPAAQVVKQDLAAIQNSDAIFAIVSGSSPGTLFEVGYAVALKKPVYCVAQNMRPNDTKLPEGAGCTIHDDLISAVHLLAWRA